MPSRSNDTVTAGGHDADRPAAGGTDRRIGWRAILEAPWSWRDVAWIVSLAAVVRLVNLWAMPDSLAAFSFPDSGEYLAGAAAWLTPGAFGAWLGGEHVLPSERMPGYFWFLAGLARLGLEAPGEIAFVQGMVDAGTCAVIARLAAIHGPGAGRLAGLVAAASPTLIVHSTLVLQDTVFLHLFAWSLLLCAMSIQRRSITLALLAGLALGGAFLIRAVVQYWVLILPVLMACAILIRDRRPLLAAAMGVAVFLGSAIPASPVLTRNVVHFDTLYPTTQTGLHALYWLVPLVRMTESGRGFEVESAANRAEIEAILEERGIEIEALGPHGRDRVFRDLARERLLAEPLRRIAAAWAQGAVITLMAPATLSDGRVRAMNRPSFYETGGASVPERVLRYLFDPFGPFQKIVLASGLVSVLALAAAALGGWTLLRQQPLAAVAVLLIIGYFLALGGPTSGPKYRMPIEPVLLATIGVGLARALSSALTDRRAHASGPP